MRGLLITILCSGCVGFYAEVGAGINHLSPSGSAATIDSGAVSTSEMFAVGIDTDFAHVSQVAGGIGEEYAQLGSAGTAKGVCTDWRVAGALRELSTEQLVTRFGLGLSVVQDQQASLGTMKFTIIDVYFGPGVSYWINDHSFLSLFVAPRYLAVDGEDAKYEGWGALARVRYTWLFGDSHFDDAHPLER